MNEAPESMALSQTGLHESQNVSRAIDKLKVFTAPVEQVYSHINNIECQRDLLRAPVPHTTISKSTTES
jgi:hypothetical protein